MTKHEALSDLGDAARRYEQGRGSLEALRRAEIRAAQAGATAAEIDRTVRGMDPAEMARVPR